MKINQKFAKKAMVVASLTAGVIGFNSIFNEAQASGNTPPVCRIQRVDCNGWFTGDKDVCITTGNSVQCSSCGASSGCY
jgi:hypothetical protein